MRAFLKYLPPTGESALFREQNPKSWWWTPEVDFLSAILVTGQGANWQRGGGKGSPPKKIDRPDDRKPAVTSAAELRARRAVQDTEMERRRQVRGGG